MRVIGGTLRGRKLGLLQGRSIRPTSDRVREALFNILGSKPVDATILDLFAGTGALGIEALSRGAKQAVFIDKAPQTIHVLRKNIALCGLEARSRIIQWDIVKSLGCLQAYHQAFDLVFLDPPYHQAMVQSALEHLLRSGTLADDAWIVVEQPFKEAVMPTATGLICEDHRRYGHTMLTFFTVSGEHIAS